MRNEGWEIENKLSQQKNLLSFEVGDVVRDYYNRKLYRIKKHGENGVSTLAELDEGGNEIAETSVNTANNVRYTLIEVAPEVNTAEKDEKSRKASEKWKSNEKEGESKSTETTQKPTFLDVVSTLYNKGKEYASKIFSMKFLDVANTPDFMKEYGLTGNKFTIMYGVLSRHFGKDNSHDLTIKDWEKLPKELQRPFTITKRSDKKNGYRLYLPLQNSKGEYVAVGVDVKNAGRDIEVNAISTVFGRRESANLPTNEYVLYKSETITPEQEALLSRPNSDQYPSVQESSGNKGTKKKGNSQDKTEKNVDEPIEDVGEKIGGARKDLYKGMQERAAEAAKQTDDELRSWMKGLSVSKIFNFDVAKLRAEGLSNEAATFIQFVKGYCPTKPRTDKWKLSRWLIQATRLYRLCHEVMVDFPKAQSTMKYKLSYSTIGEYNALLAIGGFDSGVNFN